MWQPLQEHQSYTRTMPSSLLQAKPKAETVSIAVVVDAGAVGR